jgi:hypothetical protein
MVIRFLIRHLINGGYWDDIDQEFRGRVFACEFKTAHGATQEIERILGMFRFKDADLELVTIYKNIHA